MKTAILCPWKVLSVCSKPWRRCLCDLYAPVTWECCSLIFLGPFWYGTVWCGVLSDSSHG